MSKVVREYKGFFQGIADFPKTGGEASYRLGRSVDHRTDTRSFKLLPKTIKESGSVVTDLPKWAVIPPTTCKTAYLYGDTGNIYARSSTGSYSNIHTVPNSHGNGIAYFGEDGFLYYTNDTVIGRYGPVCTAGATFNDDFFGSQGGVRTNTYALNLTAASSQYASRASTSSLQVAGDLSIEAHTHWRSLPTSGNSMVIASKWNTNGNLRSYKFDVTTTSNFFGDGSDGALTISTNTTEAPIDASCSGTIGTNTLSATNASFAVGQKILIHQTMGTNATVYQVTKIQAYTAGTITTEDTLKISYSSTGNNKAQVRVLKQYTDVTVNAGVTWTGKAWDGTVGGIGPAFFANGTFTNNGIITATGKGFRGGAGSVGNGVQQGTQAADYGEGTGGPTGNSGNQNANGNGGGGGYREATSTKAAGGGGGNATQGGTGAGRVFGGTTSYGGVGGAAVGTVDITSMSLGGSGGGGNGDWPGGVGGNGGNGGGIILLWAATWVNAGTITSNGTAGTNPNTNGGQGGGGGSGGTIGIKAQTATLGTVLITALGALGGTNGPSGDPADQYGGTGANGRINIDYLTSYTGTTNPTLNAVQDNNLGTSVGYILRLQLSNNGTAIETYSKPIIIDLDTWMQLAVTWDSTTSTATFYKDAVSLGTQTGAFTLIDANAAAFSVGCSFGAASAAENFYDGYIDEVRLFGKVRTQNEILLGLNDEILPTMAYMKAYYRFNNVYTDGTSYANTLTATGSPTFTTDTPFIGATTRLDIDQSATTAGNTYTTPIAISEAAADLKTFTPTKDPQKSIMILVAAIGTGNWTVTVHDSFNNEVAAKTIANASMATGYLEFVFATPWRPMLNQNYHFHVTSTVNDGTVTTQTASDLSTVSYRTFYQFLVTDVDYHPIANFLQFLVIGNERYVGTIEATLYEPHTLTLPAGWRVRCFGYYNEYLAIGVWKGTTIDEYDQGRIFFWDGTAPTYNFFIDVPEGAVNAMLGSRGKLYFMAGYRGKLMVYEGGAQARKIKNLINTENQNTIDIMPGAITMWRSLLRFGVCGNLDDDTIQRGVYTWGSVNDKYDDSLSFDHPISTGTYQGNTVKIGLVTTVDSKLLIGWQDNISYGVDYVDISNPPYATGTMEFLIEDDDEIYHQKQAVTITTQFEPLNSGESVQLKYKLNRNANWTLLPAVTTTGADVSREVIALGGSRYREYEIGTNLATSTTTSPTVYGVTLERDDLGTEKRVG